MRELTRYCFLWRRDCRIIQCDLGELWGPPEHEIKAVAALEYTRQVDLAQYEPGFEDLSASDEEEADIGDEELFDQMEAMALRDEYRHGSQSAHANEDQHSSNGSMTTSLTKKRARR